jgi:hypothetical protein
MPSLPEFIERVLASGLLTHGLLRVSEHGASQAELDDAPRIPIDLREVLAWRNGLDLDVVRLHGIGTQGFVLERAEFPDWPDAVGFASDPAGFQYFLDPTGKVLCCDHDGGEIGQIANSVDDFIRGYVFGPRASEFAGEDWAREVDAALSKP